MDIKQINFIRDSSKPNRTLVQWDLQQMAEYLGEPPLFPYLVILQPGASGGNHYHHIKRELIVCIRGNVDVVFEDMQSKERECVSLNGNESSGVVVPAQIAHLVTKTGNDEAEILVFATRKAREQGDDFKYQIPV
ncbi:MAG: WxcM-like domain-containing protein [Candidatus Uhrbacteria bacterium]|nr:WxcM-like domain-containing protein [Candidatus Uhrbacteria bacterium]